MEQRETRELIIEDEFGNVIGDLSLISFVKSAANETELMLLSKHEKDVQLSKLEPEKQIATGCVLRNGFKMLQQDNNTKELFDAVLSAQQIRRCSEIFLKHGNHTQTNLEHGKLLQKNQIEGVYVVESWIVEDPANDKANALGFTDINVGDWYVSFKIENKEFWEFLKGFGGGFSIEALFRQKLSVAFAALDTEEILVSQIKVIAFDNTKPDSQKEEEIKALINKK